MDAAVDTAVDTAVGTTDKNAGHRFGLPRCKAFFGLHPPLLVSQEAP